MIRSMSIPTGKASKMYLRDSPGLNNATDAEKGNALVPGGKE